MPTPFQESVYHALNQIPVGKVTTYQAVADFLQTKAVRAVGSAIGKNPNAPACPCHRVVKSNGEIGQYSAEDGVETKIDLLKSEGVFCETSAHGLIKIQHFKQVFFKF